MAQRIFDIENEKDMQDLWDILPDDVVRIYLEQIEKAECKLDLAKKSIQSALQFLACMDRISEEKCNEQLAFDELRKTLEELNK